MSEAVSAGSEPANAEISQKANERIQQLVREKKEAEAKMNEALQREVQYQEYIKSTLNPKPQPSQSPQTLDPEEELIIKELGGDETAQKLHKLLSRKFKVDAKRDGLASREEILPEVQRMLDQKLGAFQNTFMVTNRINELLNSGRLDDGEAKFVSEQVANAIAQNPAWLNNQQHARMLINNVIQEGIDAGNIKLAVKERGRPTLVSPGSGGGQGDKDAEIAELRAAASRFSTLSGLKDDELAKLGSRIKVNSDGQRITDLVKR